MNTKLPIKYIERTLVIFTIVVYLLLLIYMVSTILKENTSLIGLSRVENPLDITHSLRVTFNIAAIILVIIGIFYSFKKREFQLNKFFLYPIYLFFISRILYYLVSFMRKSPERESLSIRETVEIPWYDYAISYFGIFFLILILGYFMVRKQRILTEPVKVNKLKRLFNWLLDTLHIVVFTLVFINPFTYSRWSLNQIGSGDYNFSFLLLLFTFIYYFVSELTFGQTIGKLMDNSLVLYKGNKLKAIFIRTVCRFLPFEPFSFLFAEKGWHDQLSNTTVAVEKKSYSEDEQKPKVASEAELNEIRS